MSQTTEIKRGRGRPRPAEALERDEMVLSLLEDKPLTRNQLCDLTGLHTSIVYLSLSRLRRQGKVVLGDGAAGKRPWSVV